ncbi:MAG: hypothetical protein HYX69_23290 [Planctomycetia bacterium]|nr:hypothetical protein [Planctomycetia bacterium]
MVAVWGISSVAGLWGLWRYAATPGNPTRPPQEWPAGTTLMPNEHGSTLVMFAHPHCPCTRASLDELHRLVAQCGPNVKPLVVFLAPSAAERDWDRTDLWDNAAAIPGGRIVEDIDGREARRFCVETSGHALLYDSDGRLQFSGGITSSRGHEGDNPGSDVLVALLRGESAAERETPVFGCPIVARATR